MKKLLLPLLALMSLLSCNDPEIVDPEKATVRLKMEHHFNGTPIDFDSEFVTSYGDTIQFSVFKYYLSNLVFMDDEGNEFALEESYYLVSTEESNIQEIEISDLEAGDFTSFKLSVGVDSVANSSITDASGDLDPNGADGMIWNWNVGYKFVNTEGTYKNDSTSGSFVLHLGKDENYKTFNFGSMTDDHSDHSAVMRISEIEEEDDSMEMEHSSEGTLAISLDEGKTTEIHLMVDLAELFESPNEISLAETNTSHGTNATLFMDNIEHSSDEDANGWFTLHHITTQ